MDFIISKAKIENGGNAIIYDKDALSGIKKIAVKISGDMEAVFGSVPQVHEEKASESPIYVGTVGDALIAGLGVDTSDIEGKREVYKITVVGDALVIVGSDKRGAIYGMFKLSEMLGVSPFIDWLDVKPVKTDEFKIPSDYCMISKEPSVKFRGFFINDEWPAFGNFCNKRFGGFNAKVYEHVFELLLRLKGNYLWPAMWTAIFPDDGPGLENAILADELGVVMGMSHHEPCLRQGEEYKYLRGKDSIYGDAWNFLTNEKGITRFWEDGLKRSGKFENVITVGMRGEADTAIMGEEATLKDNIDLLRKVLSTQNRLIRENVNENLDEVPRMLALYKEVEPYFYGDENTEGLMGDPELDGVTLMLCDDNHGNLRTVPTEEMRSHKGGYGMYYHFDYHGLPVSFEWFNTSHLSKVWEQMTTAYDFGIRDLWIVNVGDVFSNEYPLGYFLDLAYDFDRYGTSNPKSAKEYTKLIVKQNFDGKLSAADMDKCAELLEGYTRITSSRRTEAMNDKVYVPFAYNETFDTLEKIENLMADADELLNKLEGNTRFVFYELIWLPLTANLNVQRMWLLTTLNHAFAEQGSTYAMTLAKKIDECIAYDRKIVDELHTIEDGKWYGMGLSEHIGFNDWCEEGCKYPVIHTFEPANKERLIVSVKGSDFYTEGKFWTGHVGAVDTFLDPSKNVAELILSTAGRVDCSYEVENPNAFFTVSEEKGIVEPNTIRILKIRLDREKYEKGDVTPEICIHCSDGNVVIKLPVNTLSDIGCGEKADGTFYWLGKTLDMNEKMIDAPLHKRTWPGKLELMNYISIDAVDYANKTDSVSGSFEVIEDYSRGLDAVKAYPQDVIFGKDKKDYPGLTYKVKVPSEGDYKVKLYVNPSNPYSRDNVIYFGIGVNDGEVKKINMIEPDFAVGDGNPYWSLVVTENKRVVEADLKLKSGVNDINVYAVDPNFVIQKLVIYKAGEEPSPSYLGPKETFKF